MASDNSLNIAKYTILDILNESHQPMQSPHCCIYKVPDDLRKENKDAFTPHMISIGPIHHDKENLKPMEKQKSFYFRYFHEQLSNEGLLGLENYTNQLGEQEESTREYYSEEYTDFNKKKFVRMILLDAVFIMELFLRKREGSPVTDNDHLFKKSLISKSIERDLLLVENQIPFRILDKLYSHVPAQRKGSCSSFLELARKYFETYDPYPGLSVDEINQKMKLKEGWRNPLHFTDLIRYFFVPRTLDNDGKAASVIKTARKLKKRGITFESVSERCLLDVKFKKIPVLYWLSCLGFGPKWFKARLQIPTLKLDGSTEYVLRNLMAFEQCHYPNDHHVCNYVALIDDLIHTEKDVDVLVESKVIVHELGSDKDLASLINILCKNIVANYSCYVSLSGKLNEHYHSSFNKILAQIELEYLPKLARIMAVIIVVVLVVVPWVTSIDERLADLLLRR